MLKRRRIVSAHNRLKYTVRKPPNSIDYKQLWFEVSARSQEFSSVVAAVDRFTSRRAQI